MSDDDIKLVDGSIPARKFEGQLWIQADVAIELRSNDRAAIDRLTADAASLRERMVEVERHLDDYVIREWRAERAKRKACEERDAAVADAEWYRWLLKRISDRNIGANVCDSVGFKNKEQTNG